MREGKTPRDPIPTVAAKYIMLGFRDVIMMVNVNSLIKTVAACQAFSFWDLSVTSVIFINKIQINKKIKIMWIPGTHYTDIDINLISNENLTQHNKTEMKIELKNLDRQKRK